MGWTVIEKSRTEHTLNLHAFTIWFQTEGKALLYNFVIAYDVISGGNLKTIEGNRVVNFEVVCCSSFRYIKRKSFLYGGGGDGGGGGEGEHWR